MRVTEKNHSFFTTKYNFENNYKEINNKTTGAWINAPLVKDIILRIIDILKIPKKIPKEILNADIKHIYKTHNVSF